jgi:hypothetical protein
LGARTAGRSAFAPGFELNRSLLLNWQGILPVFSVRDAAGRESEVVVGRVA